MVIGLNEQEGKRERERESQEASSLHCQPGNGQSDWLKCSIGEVIGVLQVTLKDAEEVIKAACSASVPGIC